MTARIRHMEPGDAPAVAALVSASWRTAYGPLIGEEKAAAESDRKHRPDLIEADLRRAHSESFVAEDEAGAIVGHAHALVTRGVLWLDRLHVSPEWQGRGVAADLMHAVMVNYLGEPSISLEVIKGNHRAVRFYQREGFIVTGERDACGHIAGVPTLIMRKPLPRA